MYADLLHYGIFPFIEKVSVDTEWKLARREKFKVTWLPTFFMDEF